MLNCFLQLVFNDLDCVFIDNGLDLQYKKLNWFLEYQIFLIFWGHDYKNLRLISGFSNAGPHCIITEFAFCAQLPLQVLLKLSFLFNNILLRSRNKFILSRDMTFLSRGGYIIT